VKESVADNRQEDLLKYDVTKNKSNSFLSTISYCAWQDWRGLRASGGGKESGGVTGPPPPSNKITVEDSHSRHVDIDGRISANASLFQSWDQAGRWLDRQTYVDWYVQAHGKTEDQTGGQTSGHTGGQTSKHIQDQTGGLTSKQEERSGGRDRFVHWHRRPSTMGASSSSTSSSPLPLATDAPGGVAWAGELDEGCKTEPEVISLEKSNVEPDEQTRRDSSHLVGTNNTENVMKQRTVKSNSVQNAPTTAGSIPKLDIGVTGAPTGRRGSTPYYPHHRGSLPSASGEIAAAAGGGRLPLGSWPSQMNGVPVTSAGGGSGGLTGLANAMGLGGLMGGGGRGNGEAAHSAKEDQFWVPPAIIEKKRAQSLIPQLLLRQSSQLIDPQQLGGGAAGVGGRTAAEKNGKTFYYNTTCIAMFHFKFLINIFCLGYLVFTDWLSRQG